MIALIDYGAGNLRSVANALEHLEAEFDVTDDPETVARAQKVILPGVGAAASCVEALRARGLDEALRSQRGPVLGICLGMQVLAESSTEGRGRIDCLGLLPGHTARLEGATKLPQIGWNDVRLKQDDPLFRGIGTGEYFYFLHSYRLYTDPIFVLAESEYGQPYPAAVRRANFWGVQFHPEKSGPAGLRVLRNFVELC